MDWNLKGGSWDLTELDGGGLPNVETSRFGLVNGSGSEFCVDLKLGQVGNCGTEASGPKWKADGGGGVSKTAVSGTSGSSKRARAINNGAQTASCLVDGCSSDLSNYREYHRRHKVCELHSKTPVVTIGGLKQRFCQQCSRFHSLEEFDEGKRSCRKRLDGHNRRRRKPQPVPLARSATLFSNYHQVAGRQLLRLSSDSNMYPSSAAMVNPGWDWEWDGRTMVHYHHHHNKPHLFLGSSESARIKQETRTYHEAASACHTLLRTTARPGSFSWAEETPPPCVLSLLSSPPAPMYLSQPSLGPTTFHDHHSLLQDAMDTTLLVSNGTQPSMFNLLGSDASSQGIHTSQSLPFHRE